MMAAWQVRPPRLVTMALARFMTGSQLGSVISVTNTSPGLHLVHLADAVHRCAPGRCRFFGRWRGPSASTAPLPSELVAQFDLGLWPGSSPFLGAPAGCRASRRRRLCPTQCP
jgi:hypothetical protein